MHSFLRTLTTDQRKRVVDAITSALEITFTEDGARQTQAEIKRRFEMCLAMVAELRTDLRWSFARISDTLPLGARQTQAEIKRRFEMCLAMVAELRTDLRWSFARISDTLPTALRAKLDGADWNPSTRNSWTKDETTGLILPPGAR